MLEVELSRLLLSIVLLITLALIVGNLFTQLGIPRVIGELMSGVILGPSLLGSLYPSVFTWIFRGFQGQSQALSTLYWLGLILLMFTAGFSLNKKIEKNQYTLIAVLVFGGLVAPFMAGFIIFSYRLNFNASNDVAFCIIIGAASAVTSLPVISRIFMEQGIIASRFAQSVLSAAAIQDIFLWVAISYALSIQREVIESYEPSHRVLSSILSTLVFSGLTLVGTRFLLKITNKIRIIEFNEAALTGYVLLTCLVVVLLATLLKVSVVFGALIAGITIGQISSKHLKIAKDNIGNLANYFFTPLYFALVGLNINLIESFNIINFFDFFINSSIVKILSIIFLLQMININWLNAADYGITMNARGGPGIVLASLAYASGVISQEIFVAIVLTSVFTSLVAGLWLRKRRNSIS